MGERIKKLLQDGDRLWSNRQSLESLWQEIAYQFHVDMADFTITRYEGDDFADHLTTSYPLIARRTLGNALSWTFYLLSKSPEVRLRLFEEVDSVLGGRVPVPEDQATLPFTRQVIQ